MNKRLLMKFHQLAILLGVIIYYLCLIYLSISDGDFLRMIWGAGPFLCIIPVFKDSKYYLQIYFSILAILVIISGLILAYVYIFMPQNVSNIAYYSAIFIALFYASLLILSYIYRGKIDK